MIDYFEEMIFGTDFLVTVDCKLETFIIDHIIHCDYIKNKLAWLFLSEVPTNHYS